MGAGLARRQINRAAALRQQRQDGFKPTGHHFGLPRPWPQRRQRQHNLRHLELANRAGVRVFQGGWSYAAFGTSVISL